MQDNVDGDIGNTGLDSYYFAQSFTATASYTCCKAAIKLYNMTGETVSIQVGIYSDSSGSPGSIIGAFSDTLSATNVSGGEAFYDFPNLNAPIVSGSHYWVVTKISAPTTGLEIRRKTLASVTKKSSDGVTWTPYLTGITTMFRLYSSS